MPVCLSDCLFQVFRSSPTINKDNTEKLATVVVLGYSVHIAHILCVVVNTLTLGLRSKKLPTFMGLGTFCTHTFKIIVIYKLLAVTALYVLEVIQLIRKYKSALEQNVPVHDYNTRKNEFTCFSM
jgi:hypothetical protein